MRGQSLRRWSVGGVLAVGVAVGGLLFGSPTLLNSRVVGPYGVVGVASRMSYAWIIPTAHGVALVDAGASPSAKSILDELARRGLSARDVHHILITHGHVDHWAGVGQFPNATLLVGKADVPLIRGEEASVSLGGRFARWTGADVAPPPRMVELEGEQTLDVDGEPIRYLPLPGHTPGSGAWLFRDLLFTGDSLNRWRDDWVDYASVFYTDDPAQNRASVAGLEAVDFATTADGHQGIAIDAKAKLRRLLHGGD